MALSEAKDKSRLLSVFFYCFERIQVLRSTGKHNFYSRQFEIASDNYQNSLNGYAVAIISDILYRRSEATNTSHSSVNYAASYDSDSLDENNLTVMCMSVSEQSLARDWDNDEDSFWDTF